ncbi:MAG: FxsA family protein [Rhizobiales bacterium]|nr:FxsA family protein [Hyphomicrobiales bacterium]
MALLFLLIFIAIPVIEIGLFIQVGGAIGLFSTLAIVIITAMIGTYLLRKQGLNVLMKLQSDMAEGKLPLESLIHGAFIVVAGLLLLTPGFFTDFIGFSFFIPQVRLGIAHLISSRVKKSRTAKTSSNFQFHSNFSQKQNPQGFSDKNEIEGEYDVVDIDSKKIDDVSSTKNPESPWNEKD